MVLSFQVMVKDPSHCAEESEHWCLRFIGPPLVVVQVDMEECQRSISLLATIRPAQSISILNDAAFLQALASRSSATSGDPLLGVDRSSLASL